MRCKLLLIERRKTAGEVTDRGISTGWCRWDDWLTGVGFDGRQRRWSFGEPSRNSAASDARSLIIQSQRRRRRWTKMLRTPYIHVSSVIITEGHHSDKFRDTLCKFREIPRHVTLLQIFRKVCRWKCFEMPQRLAKIMNRSLFVRLTVSTAKCLSSMSSEKVGLRIIIIIIIIIQFL